MKLDVATRGPGGQQGSKDDPGKLRYDLVQDRAEREFVGALTHGAVNYGDGNWRNLEDLAERYFAAARRHMADARAGKRVDPGTMMHPLANAICCLHFWLASVLDEEDDASFEARLAEGIAVARRKRAERLTSGGG